MRNRGLMQLRGIATALYDKDGKSVVSVTNLNSKSAEDIFIEKTQKTEVGPLDTQAVRDTFLTVLNEICAQPAQVTIFKGQPEQIPTTVIYGTTETHPVDTYRSMIRGAFPEYFDRTTNEAVHDLLNKLISQHHTRFRTSDSSIEPTPFYLYPSNVQTDNSDKDAEERVNKELDRLRLAERTGFGVALIGILA